MRLWLSKSKLTSRYCLLALTFAALSLNAFSKPVNKIKAVSEVYPPYQKYDQQGNFTGCSTEVVQAMFKVTKDQLELEVMPWPRTYATALNEANVMLFSVYRTKSREQLFHWVGRLTTTYNYFWGLKSNFPQPLKSLDQAKNFTVAVTKNYYSDIYLTKNNFSNLHRVTQQEQSMNMLFHQRVNLMVGDEKVIKVLTNKLNYDFTKLTKVFNIAELNSELSVAFNLNSDPETVKRYQDAFTIIENKGIVDKIMTQCKQSTLNLKSVQ